MIASLSKHSSSSTTPCPPHVSTHLTISSPSAASSLSTSSTEPLGATHRTAGIIKDRHWNLGKDELGVSAKFLILFGPTGAPMIWKWVFKKEASIDVNSVGFLPFQCFPAKSGGKIIQSCMDVIYWAAYKKVLVGRCGRHSLPRGWI